MAVKKKGLGRGLDALFPEKSVKPAEKKPEQKSVATNESLHQQEEGSLNALAVKSAAETKDTAQAAVVEEPKKSEMLVKISKVEPNRTQPRKQFDEDALLELSESIKQFGILQPLLVSDKGDYYEIIAGERRWRAAKLAGVKEVPVIIKEFNDQQVVEISLIENIQREDLNPIEEAMAYKRLINEFKLKQDNIAERVSYTFGDHGLTAMLGQSVREENWRNLWGEATGVPGGHEEYYYLNQGNADGRKTGDDGTTYRGVSWFGRVSYDYKGKYLLSATMRADGSSKYQEKWGYFPSVGAAWNISEEGFMKDQKWVDYLKLRASWGKLGNDKVAASDGFASITQDMGTSGIFGGSAVPGYTNLVYFSWLGWEVVNETNVGLDFRTLNSRLTIEADWYYRLTQNAVIDAPLPMGAGNLLGNRGEILNTGVELSFNWADKIGKDFSYYIGANLTTLHNEVKDLNGLSYLYGGSAEFRTISQVGGELNAYYGYDIEGVYQNAAEIAADPIAVANGLEPGDFKYVDQNKDGKIDNKDRVTLGSYIPNFNYGINLGFSYKNFDFSMVMQGVAGNQIVNRKRGDRRWHSELNYDLDQFENRWTGEGSTNEYMSAKGSVKPWNISNFNSFYVEDGSYFRIQNVQVAYTFPKKDFGKFKMPSIRLSLTADRPLTVFKANSFSPELGSKNEKGEIASSSYGFDERVYPLASSYTLGLRIIY